ncbi:MAG: TfoX/Sxy family protein [Bacteroidota bacterium]
MAYNTILADRIRHQLIRRRNFTEKKMFGGICFLLNGNMCCGVIGQELIIRVTTQQAESFLREKDIRAFDFTGKPSKNMIYVGSNALQSDTDLKKWLVITMDYVKSLPKKN